MSKIKMKTKRAAAKRFHVTATGKMRYKKTQQSSNTPLSKSSRRIKRALRRGGELVSGDVEHVKRMCPYFKRHAR